MAIAGNAGNRLSKLYSAPLFSPFRTVDAEEELRIAQKARLRKSLEEEFTSDYLQWTTRSGPLPALPPSLPPQSPTAHRIQGAIAQRQHQLQTLQKELELLEIAAKLTTRPEADHPPSIGDIQSLMQRTAAISGENETYQEVVARLKLELAGRRKKATELTKVVRRAEAVLQTRKSKDSSDMIEINEINNKRAQAETALIRLQKERLDLLANRLEETTTSRSLVSQQKSNLLDQRVHDFERKQAVSTLKSKLAKITLMEKHTSALRAYHCKLKAEHQTIRGNFDTFFGTNDADKVISMFRREANRAEMLRQAIEEMLLTQNKSRKELEELKKQKNDLQPDQYSLKTTKETEAIPSEHQLKVKLVHQATISLTHIYKHTIEKDRFSELSPEIPVKSSPIALVSIIQKRVETAVQICGQSQYLLAIGRLKPALQKRLTIKRQPIIDLREENFLKYSVLQGHFILNPDSDAARRRISTTIDSMLSSVASLLTQPTTAGIERHSIDGKRRRNWRMENSHEDEAVEEQEEGYWGDFRRLKRDALVSPMFVRRIQKSKSETVVRMPKVILGAKEPKIDFGEVISDLRAATRQVKKLKVQCRQRNWESLAVPSSASSSKTKDSSEGFPLSPRLSSLHFS